MPTPAGTYGSRGWAHVGLVLLGESQACRLAHACRRHTGPLPAPTWAAPERTGRRSSSDLGNRKLTRFKLSTSHSRFLRNWPVVWVITSSIRHSECLSIVGFSAASSSTSGPLLFIFERQRRRSEIDVREVCSLRVWSAAHWQRTPRRSCACSAPRRHSRAEGDGDRTVTRSARFRPPARLTLGEQDVSDDRFGYY